MNPLWLPLLLSSVIWAEEQYFLQSPNATWDEARLYCQSCFRELTTITSRNVHLIVKNLSSSYWIGLRRSYNGSFPWEEWSNGDPVTYQNWYPGHPIPNKEKKLIPICSSTTESPMSTVITTAATSRTSTMFQNVKPNNTCPVLNNMLQCLNMTCGELESVITMCDRTTTTSVLNTFTTTLNAATNRTITESTTASNCIFIPEPDPEHYIDDACVVLLKFGMWKEEHCNASLPYICYEERFFGQIYVSDVNTSAVNLSWTEGPGAKNISHYRVEISEDNNQTINNTFNQTFNQTKLSQHIENLSAGTRYRVQVFPVKCGRDLNPQNISFYTQPSDVQNLAVVGMTTVSANLIWRKPEGNRDFYSVTFMNGSKPVNQKCYSEDCTITDLIPGTEYIFTVTAVVNETFGGVPSSVSDYTIPSTVRKLTSANNDSTVITASWDPPEGGHSGYRYCLTEINHNHICSITGNCSSMTNNSTICKNTTQRQITESGKSDGSKFCLCVEARTKNDTLPGAMVVISAYTRPKSVILSLTSKSNSMMATWDIGQGKYEKFEVNITTDAYAYIYQVIATGSSYNFQNLKAGVYYTVSVITINGDLRSNAAVQSKYTTPTAPAWVNATATQTSIELTWGAPDESQDVLIQYKAEYYTVFWEDKKEFNTDKTSILLTGLNPGTRYNLTVSVVAGNLTSDPATIIKDTVPVKRTLILTMLCSSETALLCDKDNTRKELFEKLKNITYQKFENNVYWNLNWAKRN